MGDKPVPANVELVVQRTPTRMRTTAIAINGFIIPGTYRIERIMVPDDVDVIRIELFPASVTEVEEIGERVTIPKGEAKDFDDLRAGKEQGNVSPPTITEVDD